MGWGCRCPPKTRCLPSGYALQRRWPGDLADVQRPPECVRKLLGAPQRRGAGGLTAPGLSFFQQGRNRRPRGGWARARALPCRPGGPWALSQEPAGGGGAGRGGQRRLRREGASRAPQAPRKGPPASGPARPRPGGGGRGRGSRVVRAVYPSPAAARTSSGTDPRPCPRPAPPSPPHQMRGFWLPACRLPLGPGHSGLQHSGGRPQSHCLYLLSGSQRGGENLDFTAQARGSPRLQFPPRGCGRGAMEGDLPTPTPLGYVKSQARHPGRRCLGLWGTGTCRASGQSWSWACGNAQGPSQARRSFLD